MIAIIDYGVGNLGSVLNAFKYLGYEAKITSDKNEILSADKVILPGVGAFKDAMEAFKKRGFVEVIKEVIERGTPILGICVGMQMLFEKSYEFQNLKHLSSFEEVTNSFSFIFKILQPEFEFWKVIVFVHSNLLFFISHFFIVLS